MQTLPLPITTVADAKIEEIHQNLEAIDARALYAKGLTIQQICNRVRGASSPMVMRIVANWLAGVEAQRSLSAEQVRRLNKIAALAKQGLNFAAIAQRFGVSASALRVFVNRMAQLRPDLFHSEYSCLVVPTRDDIALLKELYNQEPPLYYHEIAAQIGRSESFVASNIRVMLARGELEKRTVRRVSAHTHGLRQQIIKLKAEGRSKRDIARSLGMSHQYVYQLLAAIGDNDD